MIRSFAGALLAAAAISAACTSRPGGAGDALLPATDPREAALSLLQAAQTGRTSKTELAALLPDDLPAEQWSALAEVLAPLRPTTRARILTTESLGADRSAVDLELALAGGGTARYSVEVARAADGTWRVASLDGPGATWPPAHAPRDEGLSTSAPPPPAQR